MKEYTITVKVRAADEADAILARDEVAESLQDAVDSGALPQLDYDVGPVVAPEEPDPEEEVYRQLAAEHHHKDGELEFDADAKVSMGDDNGAYVQGWYWIDAPEGVDPVDNLAEAVESEGGHCD